MHCSVRRHVTVCVVFERNTLRSAKYIARHKIAPSGDYIFGGKVGAVFVHNTLCKHSVIDVVVGKRVFFNPIDAVAIGKRHFGDNIIGSDISLYRVIVACTQYCAYALASNALHRFAEKATDDTSRKCTFKLVFVYV